MADMETKGKIIFLNEDCAGKIIESSANSEKFQR